MIRIAVIDTGVNQTMSRNIFGNISVIGGKDKYDSIGHGSAVISILLKRAPFTQIISIRAFAKHHRTKGSDLIKALDIAQDLNVDIVHFSNGINYLTNNELERKVKSLLENNILIVAASDNFGSMSYPACLDGVIGVYWDISCRKVTDYKYVEGSPLNILGYGGIQILPWKKGVKKVSGSSFAAPYITAKIAKFQNERNSKPTLMEVLQYLKKHSKNIVNYNKDIIPKKKFSDLKGHISRAVVIELNKETRTLISNADLCNFKIIDVFDIPPSQNIGRKLGKILYKNCLPSITVKSSKLINWNADFDTVILGHTNLVDILHNKDFKKGILEKCAKYQKNIYSFDDISMYIDYTEKIKYNGNFCYDPYYKHLDISLNAFGSLYRGNRPVIALVGTSKCQGKYTLQLSMFRQLKKIGYSVGMIATEPSGYLLGADFVYANGYNASNELNWNEEIFLINREINKLCEKDLIIVGTQSQIIPYSFGNLGFYTVPQNNVLMATEPDVYIICLNVFEEISYIQRVINFINSYYNKKNIILSIFPFVKNLQWNNFTVLPHHKVDLNVVKKYRKLLIGKIKGSIFINGEEDDLLVEKCLSYF